MSGSGKRWATGVNGLRLILLSVRLAVFWVVLPTSHIRADLLPLPPLEPDAAQLRKLSRFSSLAMQPRPRASKPVRVIYYGQSITEQAWWQMTASDLKNRYPNVPFVIENLAIGGFQAHALARTAEADLVSVQPDLVILHAYGDEKGMDELLSLIRS